MFLRRDLRNLVVSREVKQEREGTQHKAYLRSVLLGNSGRLGRICILELFYPKSKGARVYVCQPLGSTSSQLCPPLEKAGSWKLGWRALKSLVQSVLGWAVTITSIVSFRTE